MENISFEEKSEKIIVRARGEWTLGNIKDIELAFSNMLGKKPTLIALDCKDLIGVDSTAIASLVKILRKCKELNIRLVFFDLSSNIMHTFELMTLNKFFTIMTRQKFEKEFGG
jgi:anti-anti-sigma factor